VDKKIIKNSLFFSGSQIIARFIGFLNFIFLARLLSVPDFGIFVWVLGFVYNFYPLADFGLERLVLRELPRKPQKAQFYFSRLIPLRIFLSIGTVLVCLLAATAMGIGKQKLLFIFLFSLTILPQNLIFLIAAIKNSQEKAKTFSILTILISLLPMIVGITMVLTNQSSSLLFLSFFSSELLILLILLSQIQRLDLKLAWKLDISFGKKLLAQSWPMACLTILAVFYLRISLILTGKLLGNYWAGIYGAASKFVEAGILIPQGLALALFPSFSRLLVKNKKKLAKIYQKAILVLFLLSLPIAAAMYWGGSWIIPLIFGQQYQPAIPIFSLFGVLMIFFFTNCLAGNIIQNSKKLKKFIPWAAANFLVALMCGLILIPKMGIIGGVWAMIGGEIFGLIINNIFVFRILKTKVNNHETI